MTDPVLTPPRNESESARLHRHWNELLQELRVAQTGVQVLTGFLLTVPFQARFPELDGFQRTVFLSAVLLSVLSSGFLIAPVAVHRALFRAGARPLLVEEAQRLAIAGLVLLGSAMATVVWLVFDVVMGRSWGYSLGGGAFGVLALLWAALPLTARRAARRAAASRGQPA